MLKTFLRGLKTDDNIKFLILFMPIWLPVLIIDMIFKLNIYISEFEEASVAKDIVFKDFEKYILLESCDIGRFQQILKSFQNNFDPIDYNYSLKGSEINLVQMNKSTIVFLKNIRFESFNTLIKYLDNSAIDSKISHVKGVLINKSDLNESYFIQVDSPYDLKLIGKTYTKKKIYVNLREKKETIYFNSNIEYIRSFDFKAFMNNIYSLT